MKGKNGVHHGGLTEAVRGFFGAQGALAGAKGYESRPGQAKMAEKMEELILKMVEEVVNVNVNVKVNGGRGYGLQADRWLGSGWLVTGGEYSKLDNRELP